MGRVELQDIDLLLKRSNTVLTKQETLKEVYADLNKRVSDLALVVEDKKVESSKYINASALIGNLADENTKSALNKITGVINKALSVLFVQDTRVIKIEQVMYRKVYPHFVVELVTGDGTSRSFKQSGSGLAQVISFLYVVCLIDARGGRKLLVMDELLNGLHPDAKVIIKELLKSLAKRFQFIVVEYGLDVGKQYEAVKTGSLATVKEYESGKYYEDLALSAINKHKTLISRE